MAPIITVTGVSKRYYLGHQQGRGDGLRHRIEAAMRAPWRWLRRRQIEKRNAREEFWALRDLNFEVNQGDAVGIIGRNGAGKSTLLKILSRITEPTEGRIHLRGRVASLLEVGTGFHPELTGRENIYLNGAILGMSKAEITRKFDEIVAFSEIEKFLDTPVKRYSSGMYVRLAFAVAAHLEPEILIVDEVLAVGDSEFQKKCLGKMHDIGRGGRTVLFVSHNMSAIRNLCSKGILLQSGRTKHVGSISGALAAYEDTENAGECLEWRRNAGHKRGPVRYETLQCQLRGEQPRMALELHVELTSEKDSRSVIVAFDISDVLGVPLMQALPSLVPFPVPGPGRSRFRFDLELPPLVPGVYKLSAWVGPHNTETYDFVPEAVSFEVKNSPTPGRTFPHTPEHGFIVPNCKFHEEKRKTASHAAGLLSLPGEEQRCAPNAC